MEARTCWKGHAYFGTTCHVCDEVNATEKLVGELERGREQERDEFERLEREHDRDRKEARRAKEEAETARLREDMAAQRRHEEMLSALRQDQEDRDRREREEREHREAQDAQRREARREREEQRRLEREEARAEREAEREQAKFRRAHKIEIEAEALLRRAEVVLEQDDPAGAAPLIRRALEVAPHWPWCWLHLAVQQKLAGQDPTEAARKALALAERDGASLEPATADHDSTPWIDALRSEAEPVAHQHSFDVRDWPSCDADVFLYWLSRTEVVPAGELDAMIASGRGRLSEPTFELGFALASRSPAARRRVYSWAERCRQIWTGRLHPVVSFAMAVGDPERATAAVRASVDALARWPSPSRSLTDYRDELRRLQGSLLELQRYVAQAAPHALEAVRPSLEEASRRIETAEADWLAARARSMPPEASSPAAQKKQLDERTREARARADEWARGASQELRAHPWLAPFRAQKLIAARLTEIARGVGSQDVTWTGHDETDRGLLAEQPPRVIAWVAPWRAAVARVRAVSVWRLGVALGVVLAIAWRVRREGPFFDDEGVRGAFGTLVSIALTGAWSAVLTMLLAYLAQSFHTRRRVSQSLNARLAELGTKRGITAPQVEERSVGTLRFAQAGVGAWLLVPLVAWAVPKLRDAAPSEGPGVSAMTTAIHSIRGARPTPPPDGPRPAFVTTTAPTPRHRLDFDFNHQVRLLGYDVDVQDAIEPGQWLTVTWYWQCLAPVEPSWRLATHVNDDSGVRHNADQFGEARETYPLARWRAGDYVRDTQRILISSEWPSNSLRVYHAIWREGERMEVFPASDGERRALALTLPVRHTPVASEPSASGSPSIPPEVMEQLRQQIQQQDESTEGSRPRRRRRHHRH